MSRCRKIENQDKNDDVISCAVSDFFDEQSTTQEQPIKKKRGRPRKSETDKKLKMKNGSIKPDDLFLFVSRESIPDKHLPRFLELCDAMIMSLGVETLNQSDIEEIALMYRERIYLDIIYNSLGQTSDDGITDSALIQQIVKLGSQLEARKENLAIRFKDKGKTRQESNDLTMMDLLSRFKESGAEAERAAKIEAALTEVDIVEEGGKQKKITSTKDYMEQHIGKMSQVDMKRIIKDTD